MKIFLKKIFLFFSFTFSAMVSVSQAKIIFAEDATGRISGVTAADISKRVDGLKNLNKEKAVSLKKSLAAQLKILYQVQLLNPPVGFHPRAAFGIDPQRLTPLINFAKCDISFGFYYLEKQAGSETPKISMDGTSLAFETNAAAKNSRHL